MGSSISGVGVLDKAVVVLSALERGPANLHELTQRTHLPRATTHRLASALEVHGLVERDGGGRFRLGLRLAEMGRVAGVGRHRSLAEMAVPVLGRLRDETGESAQLYVRSGDGRTRVCLAALESPHGLRTIVAVGAVLPMDRGSAGKVLAGVGGAGDATDAAGAGGGAGTAKHGDTAVEERGWAESVEEREVGVASVSAPVTVAGEVVAAVSVSGPVERTTRRPGRRYASAVMAAARELGSRLEAANA